MQEGERARLDKEVDDGGKRGRKGGRGGKRARGGKASARILPNPLRDVRIWKSVPARHRARQLLVLVGLRAHREEKERDAPAKIQLSAIVLMKPSAALLMLVKPVLASVLISTCACFKPVTTTRSPNRRSASRSSTCESVMR